MKYQHYNCMPKYMPHKLFNLWIPLRMVPSVSRIDDPTDKYLQWIYILSFCAHVFSYLLYGSSFNLHIRSSRDFHGICHVHSCFIFCFTSLMLVQCCTIIKCFDSKAMLPITTGNKLMIGSLMSLLKQLVNEWNAGRTSG